jgi:hypothetical protein
MASVPKVENERWDVAWRGFTPGSLQERVNVLEIDGLEVPGSVSGMRWLRCFQEATR